MDVDFVKTSIGSYKTRLKDREDDAIAAIKDGSYWTAQIALNECAGFKAVIEELEFQLEVMVNAAWDAGYAKGVDWAKKCGGGIDAMTDAELAEHGLVRLPVDADGEPIHAGDVLDGYGKTIEVVEMRYGRGGWVLISRDGNGYADTFAFTHHHAPTVEDVLREFADEMNQNLGMYTGEVIDADDWRDADAKTVEKFAAKLRLAEGVDE